MVICAPLLVQFFCKIKRGPRVSVNKNYWGRDSTGQSISKVWMLTWCVAWCGNVPNCTGYSDAWGIEYAPDLPIAQTRLPGFGPLYGLLHVRLHLQTLMVHWRKLTHILCFTLWKCYISSQNWKKPHIQNDIYIWELHRAKFCIVQLWSLCCLAIEYSLLIFYLTTK